MLRSSSIEGRLNLMLHTLSFGCIGLKLKFVEEQKIIDGTQGALKIGTGWLGGLHR